MTFTTDDAIALVDKIEAAIGSPHALASIRDDAVRCKLRDAASKLSLALETHNDVIHRIAYSVCQHGETPFQATHFADTRPHLADATSPCPCGCRYWYFPVSCGQ